MVPITGQFCSIQEKFGTSIPEFLFSRLIDTGYHKIDTGRLSNHSGRSSFRWFMKGFVSPRTEDVYGNRKFQVTEAGLEKAKGIKHRVRL